MTDTMLRQFITGGLVRAVLIAAMLAGVTACGIKGPLRPAPKAVAPPPPPAVDNPATPPATTSPALPPPSSTNERKP
ncbi:MAG: lipoprotein [Betaproteobacteria bacterium]